MGPRFVIPVQDIISVGSREIDAALPPEWLTAALSETEFEAGGTEDGRLNARLSMSGKDVVVRGRVRVKLRAICGRCLQPTDVKIDAELSLLLVLDPSANKHSKAQPRPKKGQAASKSPTPSKSPSPSKTKAERKRVVEEYEFTSDEADADTYDGEQVVLDQFIREAILLEMPIFPLCSEACPGIDAIPPQASEPPGDRQRVDPRLMPLLAFQTTRKN